MSHLPGLVRKQVLEVLSGAFRQNPWLNAIAPFTQHPRRYRAVLEYACATASQHRGIHVSPCGQAVALYYIVWPDEPMSWPLVARKFWLAFGSFAWWDVPAILHHQAQVKALRPVGEPYMYCWFLGATPAARRAGKTRGLVNELFRQAQALRLPIYAETTLERNCRVYERFGMQTYAVVASPRFGVTSFCMRWLPEELTSSPRSKRATTENLQVLLQRTPILDPSKA